MEKNLKLKNDIWIWHISLQNNGYRLPEIISDIIYKYTKTTNFLKEKRRMINNFLYNFSFYHHNE